MHLSLDQCLILPCAFLKARNFQIIVLIVLLQGAEPVLVWTPQAASPARNFFSSRKLQSGF